MSNYFCWTCDTKEERKYDMKCHMVNAHGRLKFVCVWCEGREATFRKAVDPEAYVTMAHKSVYKEAPQDAFGEPGCFWLSKFPKDYLRLVKPSQRYGAEARFLKRALERWWPTLQKNSSKTMADWRAGWSGVWYHFFHRHRL